MTEQDRTKEAKVSDEAIEEGEEIQAAGLALAPTDQGAAIFSKDPREALAQMETIVTTIASKCAGPRFISDIQGKKFPKVDWWTTIGGTLGLFPITEWARRLDRPGEITYEARVSVKRHGQEITAGEAICSSLEKSWRNKDEYAIKSMSITRATGKAFRVGFSMLAVMAGLEPTPAEEITSEMLDKKHAEQFPEENLPPIPEGTETKAPRPETVGKTDFEKQQQLYGYICEMTGIFPEKDTPLSADEKASFSMELVALTEFESGGEKVEGEKSLRKLKGPRLNVAIGKAKAKLGTAKDELLRLLEHPGLSQEIVDGFLVEAADKRHKEQWFKDNIAIVKGLIADVEEEKQGTLL